MIVATYAAMQAFVHDPKRGVGCDADPSGGAKLKELVWAHD
jgi:hypothetical protein